MRVDQWSANVAPSVFFFRALPRKLHVVRKVGVVGVRVGYSRGVKMRRALPREPHIVKNCGVVGAADRNSHGLKVGRSGMETHGRSKYGMKVGIWSARLAFHAAFDVSGYNCRPGAECIAHHVS